MLPYTALNPRLSSVLHMRPRTGGAVDRLSLTLEASQGRGPLTKHAEHVSKPRKRANHKPLHDFQPPNLFSSTA
jgi:hypothetical protein